MHATNSYYLYGTFHLFLLSNDPLPPKDGGFFKLGGSFKEAHNILLPVEKFFKGCQQKIEVKITWAGLF